MPLSGLSALLLAFSLFCLLAGRLSAKSTAPFLLALIVFEIGNVTGSEYRHREQKWSLLNQLYENDDLAAFLKGNLGDGRFAKNSEDVPFNLGDWFGVDEYEGYVSVPENIMRLAFNDNTVSFSA